MSKWSKPHVYIHVYIHAGCTQPACIFSCQIYSDKVLLCGFSTGMNEAVGSNCYIWLKYPQKCPSILVQGDGTDIQ